MKMPEPQERIISQLTSPFRWVPDMITCSTRQEIPSFVYNGNMKLFGEEHPELTYDSSYWLHEGPVPGQTMIGGEFRNEKDWFPYRGRRW